MLAAVGILAYLAPSLPLLGKLPGDIPRRGLATQFAAADSRKMRYTENMAKTTTQYWNPLTAANASRWSPVKGLEGMAEELTLSEDPITGEYTRLTRFHAGADTVAFGGKSHAYPEEVFVVSGRLYDQAFDLWLEAGHYASRPPGEVHGPFRTDVDCVVLELSFPQRTDSTD